MEVSKDSFAVCDIGRFTTDIVLMRKGRFNQSCSGSAEGAHIAAKFLRNLLKEKEEIKATLTACEEAMRTNTILFRGKKDVTEYVNQAKDHLAEHIIDRMKDYLGGVIDEVSSVFIGGGGAHLVFDHLHSTWDHCVMVDNPRMSIAEGMRRMGVGIKSNR